MKKIMLLLLSFVSVFALTSCKSLDVYINYRTCVSHVKDHAMNYNAIEIDHGEIYATADGDYFAVIYTKGDTYEVYIKKEGIIGCSMCADIETAEMKNKVISNNNFHIEYE